MKLFERVADASEEAENESEELLSDALDGEIYQFCKRHNASSTDLVDLYLKMGVKNVLEALKDLVMAERQFREKLRTRQERRLLSCDVSKTRLEEYEKEENLRNGSGC